MGEITFQLKPLAPYRLDLTTWALRRRPINRIDRWEDGVYRRVLLIDGRPVLVSVTQHGSPEKPILHVTATSKSITAAMKESLKSALDDLLGLRIDLSSFYAQAESDPSLRTLARAFVGFKPPRFPSLFETLINAISCQQISLEVGITLLNRITAACGTPADDDEWHAFPQPGQIAQLRPIQLREMGYSGNKIIAITGLARDVVNQTLNLDSIAHMDDASGEAYLRQIRGVGVWTAQYALLRGLGRLDVFPGNDIGAINNLRRWFRIDAPVDSPAAQKFVEKWAPYRGLIYFHLLLSGLESRGLVQRSPLA